MTFTNFPNNLCTFCYKRVSQIEDKGNLPNIELCNRFYKHLSTFVNKTSASFTLPCEIVCCTDCEFLISEFCEVHQQIKCLELQLQLKLEMLVKVMKLADKVPSRVKALKQSFVELDNTSETSNEEEPKSLTKDHYGPSAYQIYIKLRHELLSKCCRSRSISQLQPRVVLRKLNLADQRISNTETNSFSNYTTLKGRLGFDFVIGWLMSFGAVIFLQSLYSNYHYESTADDGKNLFVCEDIDWSTSGGPLEEEEEHKVIPITLLSHSNDNDDNEIEVHSPSQGPTSFFINPTEEPENNGSSTSSEENPAETLELKHEPISEVGTENRFENLNNALRNSPSFPCQFCSVICTSESLLEKHETLRHPLFKTKLIKTNYPFLCGPCKTFYKNYTSLRRHKLSSLHRSLDTERRIKHVQILPNIKSEQTFGTNQQFKDTQAVPKKNTNTKRYNLRSAKNKSFRSKHDHSSDLESDLDKDYLQDITSSDTSSSETSDLEDNDDCQSSNQSTNDKFRCLLDNCKLKQTVYFKKFNFDQHKKLHIRGKYQCNFCHKIERTIIDLSLHETEMHSVIPSTSTSTIKSDSIYYCARCPFETQKEGTYFKHFAVHLSVNVVKKRKDNIRCNQCPASFNTKIGLLCHNKKIYHNQEPPQPNYKTHKCEKCDKSFEKPTDLEKHFDTEHPDSNICSDFSCAKCYRYFASEYSLKVHIRQMHSRKRSGKRDDNVVLPFICLLDRCKRIFKDNTSLKFHQNLHKRGKYSCKFCDIVMNSILTLSMHESSKHPFKNENGHREGLYYCSRCCYKNKSAWRYQTHFARIHLGTIKKSEFIFNENPSGKYKCNFCGIECLSASKLGYHEADHVNKFSKYDSSAKLQIQCPRWPKSYNKLSYIKHFLKIHFDGLTKGKPKVCPICQAKGTYPKDHFNTFHNTENLEDPTNIYKCEDDTCKAYFVKYFQLLSHKRKMHRQTKEWTCKICKTTYKNERSLQGHTNMTHKDVLENPDLRFACNISSCKRRFNTEDELEYHKKFARHRETGIRCEKCEKVFWNEKTLKKHMTLKHEKQSFICPECGKVFGTKVSLALHSEYHKGPEAWKFQCSTCGKKCASKFTLTAHLRTHTGEKPYVCQYCGEKYGHIHNWKNHMLKKHKNQDDLPEIRKTASTNRLSRKGTKRGECIISEAKQ